MAVAPIARARGGASWVPPAMDTCAPRRTPSSQTGAIQRGSLALSLFGLNAGRLAFRDFGGVFVPTRFGRARPTALPRFGRALRAGRRAVGCAVLRVEFWRFAMKCLATPRAVDRTSLVERVTEIPSTGALGFERVIAADDAEAVVRVVGAKAAAHGTALGS